MRKIWDIHGGIHPEENKHQSTGTAIGSIPLPPEIILPLNQHIGAPAEACVSVGDKVLKGQLVAKAQGLFSAGIHASTSGEVIAIEDRVVTHPSGMSAQCIIIKPDGEDRWTQLDACEDYAQLDHDRLVQKIRAAGIVGMGGAGFPTAIKVNPKSNKHVKTLIFNGTECEPYITADDMLMRERADDIVKGVQLIARFMGEVEETLIGIEDNKPEAIAAMQKAVEGTDIEVVVFPTKYPSGGEKQLIQILTGKEVPSGGLPADIGIVVQNVGTALAAYRAVRFGEPLISRVTTVVGETLTTQRNIDVLIGTPLSFVLEQHGFKAEKKQRLIIGGPMMGFAANDFDVPVVKTTNCILAPTQKELPLPPPAQACIRCGMCAEACPASLLPQQLFWYSQAEDHDRLKAHNLFDCIECGACSYVCPSNIPLVQYYRASKGAIKIANAEREKSDKARVRFEFRQERIAKAEAEKEAKRLARKKAAEEAKKLLAEKADSPTAANEKTTSKPVAAAAKPQAADPATQKAKLERALSSAQSRVERAQKALNDAQEEADEARLDSLRARLKQAELKASEAQAKLDEFGQAPEVSVGGEQAIKDKMAMSPRDKLEKNLASLNKRLNAAQERLAEAQANGTATVDALKMGVEKLQQKVNDAEQELAQLGPDSAAQGAAEAAPALSAAEQAIEKAKAKAAAQASMNEEEKAAAKLEALKARLEKARARLKKAEEEQDENIDAFRAGVEKLEQKLTELSN
ncbi:electron transport complex subunit RsxC [Saccharophagus degradans]|uniref:electron transport complex subunit RsxC n=1 Tax=Saccharophagus degradans TaxID=86304 RepID=UPI0024781872|nr:electron transport complex subunit RsxC [Saccharophagus degradans]WGP00126.1 electron transport complex subunit RsxC [Saccharophagus degradans]